MKKKYLYYCVSCEGFDKPEYLIDWQGDNHKYGYLKKDCVTFREKDISKVRAKLIEEGVSDWAIYFHRISTTNKKLYKI